MQATQRPRETEKAAAGEESEALVAAPGTAASAQAAAASAGAGVAVSGHLAEANAAVVPPADPTAGKVRQGAPGSPASARTVLSKGICICTSRYVYAGNPRNFLGTSAASGHLAGPQCGAYFIQEVLRLRGYTLFLGSVSFESSKLKQQVIPILGTSVH